jgi:hypothetical protein
MSRHQRAERQVVIKIVIAVEIAEMRAAGFLHKNRPGIIRAIIAGHSQGNAFEVFLMRLGGFRRTSLESIELFLQFGVHRVSPGILRPVDGH